MKNKQNPFSGHRAYSYRFEVVIFQAMQNIVFYSSMPGLIKLFCSAAPFEKGFSMRPP